MNPKTPARFGAISGAPIGDRLCGGEWRDAHNEEIHDCREPVGHGGGHECVCGAVRDEPPPRGCLLPDNHDGDCAAGDGRTWPGPHPDPAPELLDPRQMPGQRKHDSEGSPEAVPSNSGFEGAKIDWRELGRVIGERAALIEKARQQWQLGLVEGFLASGERERTLQQLDKVQSKAAELREDRQPDGDPGARQKLRSIDRIVAEMRDQHLDGYADQLERLGDGLRADWIRVTSALAQAEPTRQDDLEPTPGAPSGPAAGLAPAPGEPEPGTGWDRDTIHDLIAANLANAADHEVDQVRALLADRDQGWLTLRAVERKWLAQATRATEAERQRDDARAEAKQARAERDEACAELATERRNGAADALTWAARRLRSIPGDRDTVVAHLADLVAPVCAGEIIIPTTEEQQP